jgi:hypothetical protein
MFDRISRGIPSKVGAAGRGGGRVILGIFGVDGWVVGVDILSGYEEV